jgi:hypothetical protein
VTIHRHLRIVAAGAQARFRRSAHRRDSEVLKKRSAAGPAAHMWRFRGAVCSSCYPPKARLTRRSAAHLRDRVAQRALHALRAPGERQQHAAAIAHCLSLVRVRRRRRRRSCYVAAAGAAHVAGPLLRRPRGGRMQLLGIDWDCLGAEACVAGSQESCALQQRAPCVRAHLWVHQQRVAASAGEVAVRPRLYCCVRHCRVCVSRAAANRPCQLR